MPRKSKTACEPTARTFEGTRKGEPFTVTTTLTNPEAVEKLRAMEGDFARDCADHIELMELAETRSLPVKFRANLVAWGFKLIEDAANRVTVKLGKSVTKRVAFRKPLALVAGGEFPVNVRLCGSQSKHAGRFAITDGTGYGGAFYGYADPDGTWTPTRTTPKAIIEALTK